MLCEYQDAVERELIALCLELEDLIRERDFEEVRGHHGAHVAAGAGCQWVFDQATRCWPRRRTAGSSSRRWQLTTTATWPRFRSASRTVASARCVARVRAAVADACAWANAVRGATVRGER